MSLNLVSTQVLMAAIGIGSYKTIKKLQSKGVISPIMIGSVRKWNIDECKESILKNHQHENSAI